MSSLAQEQPITVAILAVGGQGGGVLSNWLLALAERHGWRVQTTSVPGVAQRTGATVYYLELLPNAREDAVLALMPGPAALDIVVAAELMEAGRAIQRGFVSPERTTMIASSHRAYATLEKIVPGDGRGDSQAVIASSEQMSKRFLHADMATIADRHGSAISASLFGAIAAAGVLPFERSAFEATIRDSKVGVDASLAAFADAFGLMAGTRPLTQEPVETADLAGGSEAERQAYAQLRGRVGAAFTGESAAAVYAGLDAVIDFQDTRYGGEYLDRLQLLTNATTEAPPPEPYVSAAARYVAQAMVYDDVIRVADLKTRAGRFARVRDDARAKPEQVVRVTEFMHPRFEELCATMPAALGRSLESSALAKRLGQLVLGSGKRVRTDSLRWFLVLYATAGLRRWRRGSLRHAREQAHMNDWLAVVRRVASNDTALASEILRCRRLVKGYSDTHVRGLSKFELVMSGAVALEGQTDAAAQLASLIDLAMEQESSEPLEQAVASLLAPTAAAA